jgi:predicted small metal-binding protein
MVGGAVTVRCACGWETMGTEDEVVAATTDHGLRLHNMTPTREQVLAMAIVPSEAEGPGTIAEAEEQVGRPSGA